MYYRYEAKMHGFTRWVGIFMVMTSHQRSFIARTLHEPKWYQNNSGKETRCWFTEEGYVKHREAMQAVISDIMPYGTDVRLITAKSLGNVGMKGKIQCIELLDGQETQNIKTSVNFAKDYALLY